MWSCLVCKGSGSQWELEIRFRTHVRTLYIDILCFVRYCASYVSEFIEKVS